MRTIIIKGNNWYKNVDEINTDMTELDETIEICYKKDMERLKKAQSWNKPALIVELARKYPHHRIV